MKGQGPTLLVDAGNALFKSPGLNDKDAKARAAFILETMGKLGTDAMAAGMRDLNLGAAWLKEQAEKAKVPVLSANLVDAKGKPVFPASRIVQVGERKVAFIGASPAGTFGDGQVRGNPIAAAVAAEARKLRAKKPDAIVVLAAVPYADALQLSREVGSLVDLVFQSHEGRGQGTGQRSEGNFVFPTGERGRQLGKLVVDLAGKGPFVDKQELARDQQTVRLLDTQVGQVRKRLELASDPKVKAQLKETLRQFEARKTEVKARTEAARKTGGRELTLEWVTLTAEFKEDAALAAAVRKIEPNGAAH